MPRARACAGSAGGLERAFPVIRGLCVHFITRGTKANKRERAVVLRAVSNRLSALGGRAAQADLTFCGAGEPQPRLTRGADSSCQQALGQRYEVAVSEVLLAGGSVATRPGLCCLRPRNVLRSPSEPSKGRRLVRTHSRLWCVTVSRDGVSGFLACGKGPTLTTFEVHKYCLNV